MPKFFFRGEKVGTALVRSHGCINSSAVTAADFCTTPLPASGVSGFWERSATTHCPIPFLEFSTTKLRKSTARPASPPPPWERAGVRVCQLYRAGLIIPMSSGVFWHLSKTFLEILDSPGAWKRLLEPCAQRPWPRAGPHRPLSIGGAINYRRSVGDAVAIHSLDVLFARGSVIVKDFSHALASSDRCIGRAAQVD